MPGRLPPSHVLPGKNRSISARKCCQAGSCSGSRWLLLSSGTSRLFGISAASNLDCSKRLFGSRREHMISVGTVSWGAGALPAALGECTEQDQVTNAFGVADGVSDSDRPAL